MNNEIEHIAQQNKMSIEFVTWFFNEKKAGCGNVWFIMMAAMWEGWKGRGAESTAALATIEKCREITNCPGEVDLQDWVKQLAAENAALKAFGDKLSEMHNALNGEGTGIQGRAEVACQQVALEAAMEEFDDIKNPATDRIYAGIKAEAKSHDLNAFISHYSAELDEHIANGGDQFDATSIRLRGFIVGGRMFRQKLRDEDKALALREGADK